MKSVGATCGCLDLRVPTRGTPTNHPSIQRCPFLHRLCINPKFRTCISSQANIHYWNHGIMKLLNSIASVKAISLAIVSAATMMSANLAPATAQVFNPNTTITFSNKGGYDAEYFVTGQIKTVNGRVLRNLPTFHTQNMPLFQKRSVSIPISKEEMQQGGRRIVTVTGRMSLNRQVFIQHSFPLIQDTCFSNTGTFFNPKGFIQPGFC
jgi:hypothetical protein